MQPESLDTACPPPTSPSGPPGGMLQSMGEEGHYSLMAALNKCGRANSRRLLKGQAVGQENKPPQVIANIAKLQMALCFFFQEEMRTNTTFPLAVNQKPINLLSGNVLQSDIDVFFFFSS